MEDVRNFAVNVRNGSKSYKTGERVLSNINISVDQGSIYAILGASGSGKTTLLSCILSLQSLDSGRISIFGKTPGSKECGIPGPLVGFMPQEYGLYEFIKINDILWYFGRLYGMKTQEISSRISVLKTLLQLPKLSRVIISLSGGQCRRVSLALALIHQPKLLILDEPSVGLDPVLRESIWNHLRQLVTKERVTIIVTTHYISESVQCDKVGIIRNGRMIAEDSPNSLMKQFDDAQTFDQVVTILYKKDEFELNKNCEEVKIEKDSAKGSSGSYKKNAEYLRPIDGNENKNVGVKHSQLILALGYKNLLLLFAHPIVLAFLLISPSLNSVIVEKIIGREPKGLTLNYFLENDNQSLANYCEEFDTDSSLGCFGDPTFPICSLIQKLESKDINIIQSANEFEALSNVEYGNSIGFLRFGPNYAQHLQNRLMFGNWATNETILGAEIKIRMDMSNAINSALILSAIFEQYQNSMKDIVVGCGEDERLAEYHLKINSLYGEDATLADGYITFVRPCVVVIMMFAMGTFTGAIYTAEKKKGGQARNYVAGVKFYHQLISTLITDSVILLIQASSMLFLMAYVYGAEVKGSMTLCLLIAYLSAISGVMFSILASNLVENELQITQVFIFAIFIQMFGMGSLWPVECIPWFWRVLCFGMPLTFPLDALRCVMFYGWGINHWRVFRGVGMSLIWIFGTGLFTVIIRGRKR